MPFDNEKYWDIANELGYEFTNNFDGRKIVIKLSEIQTVTFYDDHTSLGISGNSGIIAVKETKDVIKQILETG